MTTSRFKNVLDDNLQFFELFCNSHENGLDQWDKVALVAVMELLLAGLKTNR